MPPLRQQTYLAIIALLGLACACAGADAPATGPSDATSKLSKALDDALFGDARMVVAQWHKQYPLLPKRPIAQVVHFSEIDGMLVVDWPISDSGSIAACVPPSDLPGDSLVVCRRNPLQPNLNSSSFEYYEMSVGPMLRHLQLLTLPQHVNMAFDTETIDSKGSETNSTISLIETLDHSDSEPITLRVQVLSGDKQMINLALSAPTLTDLEACHPREFEEYLRPLLREFRQDQPVLAVADNVGWQVMADDWRAPPGLQSRLLPLIAQLNADAYADRERAESALIRIGEPAALFLRSADRRSWTPEQKARADKLIAEFFPLGRSGRDPGTRREFSSGLPLQRRCRPSRRDVETSGSRARQGGTFQLRSAGRRPVRLR